MGLIEKANGGVAERVEVASFTAVLRIQQQEKRNVCFVLMWLKKKGEDEKIFQPNGPNFQCHSVTSATLFFSR